MSSYDDALSLLQERGLTAEQARGYVGEMSRRIVTELCARYDKRSDIGVGMLVTWLRDVSTSERSRTPARVVASNDWERRKHDWAREIAVLSSMQPQDVVGLAFMLEWRLKRRPQVKEIQAEYLRRMNGDQEAAA